MSTQKIVSGNVQRPQNSMTVLQPGTVAGNSPVTNSLGITTVGYHSGSNGSRLPSPLSDATIAANTAGDTEPAAGRSKNATYKPLSAGTFGYLQPQKYVAMRLSNTLSGVSNTTLYTGAADFGNRRSINKIHNIRTAFLSVYTWTGGQDGAPVYTKTVSVHGPLANDYSPDHEANSSRSLPGELTLLYSKTPTQLDYPSRTA